MTTFLILALVFVGAFKLAQIVILLGAAAYEYTRLRRRIGPAWLRSSSWPTQDDLVDEMIRRGWMEEPRRRPSTA